MNTDLPTRVRSRRAEKGLTIEGLAHASGLSVATVQRVETGKHAPQGSTLAALASALDTSVAALIDPEAAA
jgi:transcriptional regulator with XRE-family HTH domain